MILRSRWASALWRVDGGLQDFCSWYFLGRAGQARWWPVVISVVVDGGADSDPLVVEHPGLSWECDPWQRLGATLPLKAWPERR